MARAGLLDVSGDESRQAPARRALRFDLESQLRRPTGLQGPHTPRVAGDGGGRSDRRTFRRYPRLALTGGRARSGDAMHRMPPRRHVLVAPTASRPHRTPASSRIMRAARSPATPDLPPDAMVMAPDPHGHPAACRTVIGRRTVIIGVRRSPTPGRAEGKAESPAPMMPMVPVMPMPRLRGAGRNDHPEEQGKTGEQASERRHGQTSDASPPELGEAYLYSLPFAAYRSHQQRICGTMTGPL